MWSIMILGKFNYHFLFKEVLSCNNLTSQRPVCEMVQKNLAFVKLGNLNYRIFSYKENYICNGAFSCVDMQKVFGLLWLPKFCSVSFVFGLSHVNTSVDTSIIGVRSIDAFRELFSTHAREIFWVIWIVNMARGKSRVLCQSF